MLDPRDLGFPTAKFPSFRSNQYETIERIVESDKRFTLLVAPVGSGKSLVAVGAAVLAGMRACYLTVTKSLQSQLDRDFASMELVEIRGHSNYSCASVSYDDETGELADLECAARHAGRCHYADKTDEVLRAGLGANTNYAHWLQIGQSDNPVRLGKFDLLICDEAHRAHDLACERAGVKLYPRHVRDLLNLSLPSVSWEQTETWKSWARDALDVARRRYTDRSMDKKRKHLLTRLGLNLRRFVDGSKLDEWVVKRTGDGAESSYVRGYHLLPVWGEKYTESYLFRGIPRVLLVSATVDDNDRRHLGIPDSAYDTIEVESTFPVARRPFIYIPVHVPGSRKAVRIDHRMTNTERREVMSTMDRFIEARLDRKGLIHPRSYENMERIACESTWGRDGADIIITHRKGQSEPAIQEYKDADPPSVLDSPLIGEGHDFADALARYQVLWKMPFLPKKTDPLVAARAKSDPKWELSQMAKIIEQEYGRATRSELDWSESVTMDGHFEWLRKEARFHKWFRLAWRTASPGIIPRSLIFRGRGS